MTATGIAGITVYLIIGFLFAVFDSFAFSDKPRWHELIIDVLAWPIFLFEAPWSKLK